MTTNVRSSIYDHGKHRLQTTQMQRLIWVYTGWKKTNNKQYLIWNYVCVGTKQKSLYKDTMLTAWVSG